MALTASLRDFADTSLGRYACAIHLALARELSRHLRKAGVELTTDQCRVLFYLFFHDGCTQSDLVRMLMQDKSGVSRQLDCLERKGLLTRNPSPADVRQKCIHLTDKGWALQDACLECGKAVQDVAFRDLDAAERTQLLELLRKVLQALPE